MAIDVNLIKQLREETGVGIADCREALEESKGDLEKAKQLLKKKGLDKASSKLKREVKAGLIDAYVHSGRVGALVSIGCETDFVAKTEDFKNLTREIAMQVASMNPQDTEDLLSQAYIRDASLTIKDLINQAIAKLGENIQILSFTRAQLGK